jgi:hypothetical protein
MDWANAWRIDCAPGAGREHLHEACSCSNQHLPPQRAAAAAAPARARTSRCCRFAAATAVVSRCRTCAAAALLCVAGEQVRATHGTVRLVGARVRA